jgi:hypothetical protein
MTSSPRSSAATPVRSRRGLIAIALVGLTLVGGAAPAAYAGPDTNIQKPGHVTAQ